MNRLYHIGLNVRRLRLQRDMTQIELAEKCNVIPETICLIETGKRCPSVELLMVLAESLDTSVNTLVYPSAMSTESFARHLSEQLLKTDNSEELMIFFEEFSELVIKHFGKRTEA